MSPRDQARREKHKRDWAESKLHLAEPWTEEIKWKPVLVIKAETYKPRQLFQVQKLDSWNVNDAGHKQVAVSPCGRWVYCEKVVPRCEQLETVYNRERGTVIFDGEVLAPALHEKSNNGERWVKEPWMSLTPMETMTLRPGTKQARGHVVIAGLGLGHQLIEVSKRRKVTKITLVEKDKSLVDWILPRIEPFLAQPLHDVVVGDAYKVMPKMMADVALVDIFPSFGSNSYKRSELIETCPNISKIWAWGATTTRGR